MKKITKALLGITFGTLAMTTVLTGCGGSGAVKDSDTVPGSDGVPGWSLNKEKPVKFDWYINFSWFARHWGDSQVSKYITEKTGVDLNFIVPAGNEAEKVNTMIAGDVLPDFVTMGWYEGQVAQIIDAGLVYPLDELAEEFDPNFLTNVADPDKLGWYRQDDGHVYGYPNASYTKNDYVKYAGKLVSNETFLVRKDLYEALGKPDMTTPEGFLNALRAAKAKWPVINNQPIIPFGTSEFSDVGCAQLQSTLSHMLAIAPENDGIYTDVNLGLTENPEYIRWLRALRQAHSEGLITTDIFVDKRSQIEEKAAQGRYFCMLYQNWDMQAPQNALYGNDPNSIYIAVNGPRNTKGDDPTLAGGSIAGWTITMISKNCKNPGRAMQFLSYLVSEEGQMDTNFGIEGETFTYVNGKPELLPEIKKLDSENKNKQETDVGVLYTYWMLMDTAWQGQWGVEYAPAIEQPQLWTRPYVHSFAVYDGITIPVGSDEAIIYNEIQRRWGSVLSSLIRAESEEEFDQILADYNKFKKDQGVDKIIKLQTELLNKNKEKLGM